MALKIPDALKTIGQTVSDKLGQAMAPLWARFESLDPSVQSKVRLGGLIGGGLVAVGIIAQLWSSSYGLRAEFEEKSLLLDQLRKSSDELRALQAENSNLLNLSTPWSVFFENTVQGMGIDKAHLTIGSETPAKSATPSASIAESTFELKLSKINVVKLVEFAHQIENTGRPVKIRNLKVEALAEANGKLKGYLDATFFVSVFQNAVR